MSRHRTCNTYPTDKNIDRSNIFINDFKSKLSFSYTYIELYFLLKLINNYEPSLVELIISFIGIKDSIYCWAKFYYDICLLKYDTLLIDNIYPIRNDNISNTIMHVNYYLNSRSKFIYDENGELSFNKLIKEMTTKKLYEKETKDYYKYPTKLIRTIGLFYFMDYDYYILNTQKEYRKINDKLKTLFREEQILPLIHIAKAKSYNEKREKIYKKYIKQICKEMKQCYTLGNK